MIWSNRRWIGKSVLVSMTAGFLFWLMVPSKWVAVATLMPVEKDLSEFNFLASLGGAAANLESLKSTLSGGTAMDRLKNIIGSRKLIKRVIEKLDLMPIIHRRRWMNPLNWLRLNKPPSMIETVDWFSKKVLKLSDTTEGLLIIGISWPGDAELSAAIANRIVVELDAVINEEGTSVAKVKRIFIAERLEQGKKDLVQAENDYRAFQEKNKIFSLELQTVAAATSLGKLQESLISKDIERSVVSQFAKPESADIKKLESQIEELRHQMDKLDQAKSQNGEKSMYPPLETAPELEQEYLRLKRNVILNESIFKLLTEQFILATIDEQRQRILIQKVDDADTPEYPRLRWWYSMIAGAFLGLFGAVYFLHVEKDFRTLYSKLREAVNSSSESGRHDGDDEPGAKILSKPHRGFDEHTESDSGDNQGDF